MSLPEAPLPGSQQDMPAVVLEDSPPTKTFLLLGLCSWGTDFLTSICASVQVSKAAHHRSKRAGAA